MNLDKFRLRFSHISVNLFALGLVVTPILGHIPGYTDSQSVLAQTLQMGTEADYIPFEYRYADRSESTNTQNIIGFDMDVAHYIAQSLNLKLTIQDIAFEQLFPALKSGELDFAIAAITPTPERQKSFDFSDPYFISRHALVSRQSQPVKIAIDLPGTKIAVQKGSVQEAALLKRMASGLDVDLLTLSRLTEMIAAVREGAADVAIIDELVAEAYLENNPTLVMNVLGELAPTPVAIAFPKGSAYVSKFNQVIKDMKASGELERLQTQWFTAQP